MRSCRSVLKADEPCLICGRRAENAHWPLAVGMGRNRKKVNLPTVPLCPEHHRLGPGNAHADGWVTDRLIELAPAWWQETGQWDTARPLFETWLGRREFVRGTR